MSTPPPPTPPKPVCLLNSWPLNYSTIHLMAPAINCQPLPACHLGLTVPHWPVSKILSQVAQALISPSWGYKTFLLSWHLSSLCQLFSKNRFTNIEILYPSMALRCLQSETMTPTLCFLLCISLLPCQPPHGTSSSTWGVGGGPDSVTNVLPLLPFLSFPSNLPTWLSSPHAEVSRPRHGAPTSTKELKAFVFLYALFSPKELRARHEFRCLSVLPKAWWEMLRLRNLKPVCEK